MALTLLCGPANSGKAGAIFDRFVGGCSVPDADCWLIVPTRADVRRSLREAVDRTGVVVGGRVGTFPNLARWLAPELEAREVTPGVQRVLVRRMLDRVRDRVPAADYPGFVHAALRRIIELREAAACGGGALDESMSANVRRERRTWMLLLDGYATELDCHGLVDAATIDVMAVERASTAPLAATILVHGFDDLGELQVRLLLAAAERTDVTVSLAFEPGRVVFQRRQALIDRLVDSGASVVEFDGASFESTALVTLERRLFEPTAPPLAPSADISFVDCCGALQEVEEVARRIATLAASSVSLDRIACLSANPANARPLLEPVLRRAGIPAVFETARNLGDTPAGRAIVDLVDAVVDRDLCRFAAFARSRVAGVDADAIERWLADASLAVARGGSWWTSDVIPDVIRAAIDGSGPVVDRLRACIEAVYPATAGDARLIGSVLDALDTGARSVPDMALTPRDVRELVASILIPPPDDRPPGSVVVAPIARVRTDRFDAVILHSMHSGSFATTEEDATGVARELAYVACTRARSSLTVVRQAAGSDGDARSAHPVWLELRRLMDEERFPAERRSLDAVVPTDLGLVRWECDLGRALAIGDRVGISNIDSASVSMSNTLQSAVVRARASHAHSDDAGHTLRSMVAEVRTLRVTDLERYLGCPARWFIQRHLLPDDRREVSFRQQVGVLVHDALSDLVPRWLERRLDVDHAVERVTTIDAALESAARSARRAATDVELQYARFLLERIARSEEWHGTRVETELAFGGDGGALAPLVVDGVSLHGRIDRVDVDDASGTAVLHDYKLQTAAPAAKKLVGQGRLQLPLYWRALQSTSVAQPVAAIYRPLEGARARGIVDAGAAYVAPGGYRTDRLVPDELDELLDDALAGARTAIAGIRRGDVPARPLGGTCPTWCDLQGICRVDEVRG